MPCQAAAGAGAAEAQTKYFNRRRWYFLSSNSSHELMMQPALICEAKDYFVTARTKDISCRPLPAAAAWPSSWVNAKQMARSRHLMRSYNYHATMFETYPEQLGITHAALARKVMP